MHGLIVQIGQALPASNQGLAVRVPAAEVSSSLSSERPFATASCDWQMLISTVQPYNETA